MFPGCQSPDYTIGWLPTSIALSIALLYFLCYNLLIPELQESTSTSRQITDETHPHYHSACMPHLYEESYSTLEREIMPSKCETCGRAIVSEPIYTHASPRGVLLREVGRWNAGNLSESSICSWRQANSKLAAGEQLYHLMWNGEFQFDTPTLLDTELALLTTMQGLNPETMAGHNFKLWGGKTVEA